MKQEFGENVRLAVLHLDEKTPHLHFLVSTEHKTVKRYKNQKGEFFKETYSLNAKRFNPQFLRELHTKHSEANKKFGLKRGIKGSLRKHTDLKKFYSEASKALSADYTVAIDRIIQTLKKGLLGNVSLEEVKEKFIPFINTLAKQNKALKTKFALDLKEWAGKLSNKEKELETKEAELQSREQVYIQQMNQDKEHKRIIKNQQQEIRELIETMEKQTKQQAEVYGELLADRDRLKRRLQGARV